MGGLGDLVCIGSLDECRSRGVADFLKSSPRCVTYIAETATLKLLLALSPVEVVDDRIMSCEWVAAE